MALSLSMPHSPETDVMSDEETNSSHVPQDLQDKGVVDALVNFGISLGGAFMDASNQLSSVHPMVSTAFSLCSMQPNALGATMTSAQWDVITKRRGAMAMHLRRDAHARYLLEGRASLLTAVEEEIEALSPYMGPAVENSVLAGYLQLLFPYQGELWSQRVDTRRSCNLMFNLASFHYPTADAPISTMVDEEGFAECRYVGTSTYRSRSTIVYELDVRLDREPTARLKEAGSACVSHATVSFELQRYPHSPQLIALRVKGVAVYDALERLSYKGIDRQIDGAHFTRLMARFFKQHGEWNHDHVLKADRYLLVDKVYPVQDVYGSGFEPVPEEGQSGGYLRLEDHAHMWDVFMSENVRPLGEGVPRILMKDYYNDGRPLVGMVVDMPIAVVGIPLPGLVDHRVVYAEWQVYREAVSSTDIDNQSSSTHFMLIVDRCAMIVGSRNDRDPMKDFWRWAFKGKAVDERQWKPLAVSALTSSKLFAALKAARKQYVAVLQGSSAGQLLDQYVNTWDAPNEVTTSTRLKEEGIVTLRGELDVYDYGNYLHQALDVSEYG